MVIKDHKLQKTTSKCSNCHKSQNTCKIVRLKVLAVFIHHQTRCSASPIVRTIQVCKICGDSAQDCRQSPRSAWFLLGCHPLAVPCQQRQGFYPHFPPSQMQPRSWKKGCFAKYQYVFSRVESLLKSGWILPWFLGDWRTCIQVAMAPSSSFWRPAKGTLLRPARKAASIRVPASFW